MFAGQVFLPINGMAFRFASKELKLFQTPLGNGTTLEIWKFSILMDDFSMSKNQIE
tara:strand:+ start:104725 stop:104892 length:168 start_codon:yes stop_codon:yes gene_type:complete